jgi:acetyltransferase-like isoleucine patch superfamily enzyme
MRTRTLWNLLRPGRLIALAMSRLIYPHLFGNFGPRSSLERPLFLCNANCISVGERTSIRKGARLEVVLGAATRPQLIIGSRCMIEQNVQIIARRRVWIGSDVSIAGNCAIVDVTHPYNSAGPSNIGARIADGTDEVVIHDGCFIGFGAVILPGVELGAGCVVGANSVVTHSFGPRSIVAGIPGRLIKTY